MVITVVPTSIAEIQSGFGEPLVPSPFFYPEMDRWNRNRHLASSIHSITGWWLKNHLEKYEFVNRKDYPFFMKLTTKFMFETTNKDKMKCIDSCSSN